MKTTLNGIRACHPCEDGWEKLLKHLGKTKADDEPLDLLTVLESNGIADALWCLRAVDQKYDKVIRKLACDYALAVAHLWDMPEVVRTYLTTQDESLRAAARAAARAAVFASDWNTGCNGSLDAAIWRTLDATKRSTNDALLGGIAADHAEYETLFIKMCKEAGE